MDTAIYTEAIHAVRLSCKAVQFRRSRYINEAGEWASRCRQAEFLENRICVDVFPFSKMGASIASPWLMLNFNIPFPVWVTPKVVTGPGRTFASTDTPLSRFPW